MALLAACSSQVGSAPASPKPALNVDAALVKNSRFDYDSLVGTLRARQENGRVCFWVLGNRQGLAGVEKRLLILPATWTTDADQVLYDAAGQAVGKDGSRVRLEGGLYGIQTLPGCGAAARVFKVVDRF